MIRVRAAFVLPIVGPPLTHAWVGFDAGRVVEIGTDGTEASDLGRVALLPGLVNAHTHLELTHLSGQVPASPSFGRWVRAVMALQRQAPPQDAVLAAARRGIDELRRTGTAVVGEVTNTLATVPLLREANLAGQVFYELTGFTEPDPAARVRKARAMLDELIPSNNLRLSLAPHAPYSVSAGLFRALRDDVDAHRGSVSTVHLAEHEDEMALLSHGGGDMRTLLEELGRWPSDWVAPGRTPVEYLRDLGVLDSRMLAVHGVHMSGDDLAVLSGLGVTLVSCPRSNLYVGSGTPPLEAFYAMDVRVAFGTDSLASAPDLNLFSELAEARRIAPRVRARALLRSATLVGAEALGFGDDYGSIEVGKRAPLLAVQVPDGVSDVEEYLVGGIDPALIQWIDA